MHSFCHLQDTVNYLCDEPLIKAVSFVGSSVAGEYIHDRASKSGKRVQVRFCVRECERKHKT